MLAGFAPRNHPDQVARRGPDDAVDTRLTPRTYFDAITLELGGFTLDAAASADNALAARHFDLAADGLRQPWGVERVWCNPPYSNLSAWLEKAWTEYRAGCPLIAMLLPANRTEQRWWHEFVEPFRDGRGPVECRFVRRRLEFRRQDGTGSHAPFGSVLLVWRQ